MDTREKLAQLADDAQYDLACACGTNDSDRRKRSKDGMWVYPTSLPRGGKGMLLKTLLSNACVNDCKYCPLRAGQSRRRCTLDPREAARAFVDFSIRHSLFGMFLSSGVLRDPDSGMEHLLATARFIRREGWRGFLHLKILPGCSDAAIEETLRLASSVSVNVEAPTANSFAALSTTKDFHRDIVRPIQTISRLTGKGMPYSKVGQTTQFIVGASTETDRQIVTATDRLYRKLGLDRIYFSAYQRGLGADDLPGERDRVDANDLLTREHRLYQVDFLLRKYRWQAGDVPFTPEGQLPLDADPKQAWANLHPEQFPVRLGSAKKTDLLRVPGLGPTYATRLITMRKQTGLRRTALRDIGLRGKNLAKVRKYIVCE